jgi:heat-inducible transcriptional repressor
MLSARAENILNLIVDQYVTKVMPVPSQTIARDSGLQVSSATIRNEMAYLEKEGYLIRPHTSAGCIPSDKGYRYYVEKMQNAMLSAEEERLISHTFHQVEMEVEAWLSLSATILAQLAHNVAVVSLPRANDCKLKHVELLALQDNLTLAVVVLYGARVKQKLIVLEQPILQSGLTVISNKLNGLFSGATSHKIATSGAELTALEQQIVKHLVDIMQAEDQQEYTDPFLDGWHFILNQPEFTGDQARSLMELVEHRSLLKVIVPEDLNQGVVHVIIGNENKEKAIRNCSVVICQYGLPNEATGTISVVGPTRMQYARIIPTVCYLSAVLTGLLASLYGKERPIA